MDEQQIQNEVILGVDTHLDLHVGAVINSTGKLLGTLATSTNAAGYLQLIAWARSLGFLRRAGVEGTGTYGAGLARVLREQGVEVLEVNRPDRSKQRLKGNPTRQTLKVLRALFCRNRRQLSQNRKLALQRRCVRCR